MHHQLAMCLPADWPWSNLYTSTLFLDVTLGSSYLYKKKEQGLVSLFRLMALMMLWCIRGCKSGHTLEYNCTWSSPHCILHLEYLWRVSIHKYVVAVRNCYPSKLVPGTVVFSGSPLLLPRGPSGELPTDSVISSWCTSTWLDGKSSCKTFSSISNRVH